MIRRKFLELSSKSILSIGARFGLSSHFSGNTVDESSSTSEQILPGTSPLLHRGDLAGQMEDAIQEFLLNRTAEVSHDREQLWQRDYRSIQDYENSVSSHREHLRHIIGAVDERVPPRMPDVLASPLDSPELAQGAGYKIFVVRWQVFDPVDQGLSGLHAEGLLLQPTGHELARVIAVPEADWTPEMLAGLEPGVPASAQFGRRLAENGCQVLVPLLINRDDAFSGNPKFQMTNEPHREWVYRLAFEMGRHIIGYEVQKVLAAVDWFAVVTPQVPIGVVGYGEGGLIALYSAALDSRIAAIVVSGYFQEREGLWKEPIYRDVWGLLREFGDAEIASLIAPRSLIVEACRGPEVNGPPLATPERKNACPNGKLSTPPLESVKREVERACPVFVRLEAQENFHLVINDGGQGLPGSEETLRRFLCSLGLSAELAPSGAPPRYLRESMNFQSRLKSQIDQMIAFTQGLVEKSPEERAKLWAKANPSSPERWRETTRPLRDHLWTEVIGRLGVPSVSPNPRTRLVYDEPRFRGYEVMLDVCAGIFSYGILLVPRNMREGERRPVIVCEHGLEGRAQEVADPRIDSQFYHHFGARLADAGFVVYAPQDPFVEQERFRVIQRMAHPLKLSLYAFILGQHQQLLNWLSQLSFVDPGRIGFYGLSYGGKTAIRVPPLLDEYALSICSGDFTEGVWKMTTVTSKLSFLVDDSYDVYEFNLGNVADYAELASLMAPRFFMVERGRSDLTSTDEQTAYEFARVERIYHDMGIGDRIAIEYFDGGHTIHGRGTFEFLQKHLQFSKSQD